MELNGLINQVANYGLPVVLLFWVLKKVDGYIHTLGASFVGMYAEMQKIRFLLDNLTAALTKEKEEIPQ